MAYTTIDKPDLYFNTLIWTGDGNATRSFTGVGFQPDLLWVKTRSTTSNHLLFDVIRGTNKIVQSSTTSAEITDPSSGYLSSFDSDGFSVQAGSTSTANFNTNSATYVAWNWLTDNTSGSSNTDGTITSTVSANTTSGFSIVSYTGTGGIPVTVGHGLGVTPDCLIIKNRNTAVDWVVYHKDLGNTGGLFLNTTSAFTTDADLFNNTSPTSSVVTFSNSTKTNQGSSNHIMFAFNSVKGFSKFGSYKGNGSSTVTQGPFIYTGFKPAWTMIKRTDAINDGWYIHDSTRSPSNVIDKALRANVNSAEGGENIDFLSNGFAIRIGANNNFNNASGTYIYMAFAESPFTTSTGIPTTAR